MNFLALLHLITAEWMGQPGSIRPEADGKFNLSSGISTRYRVAGELKAAERPRVKIEDVVFPLDSQRAGRSRMHSTNNRISSCFIALSIFQFKFKQSKRR
jgi:hypothetical protein